MTGSREPGDVDAAEATFASALEDAGVDADAATFDAPWQARAFALAVALCESGRYDWTEFQGRFEERIAATDPGSMQEDVEGVYYREWMATLEDLLEDTDVLAAAELDARQAEFGAGERDESEFDRTDALTGDR